MVYTHYITKGRFKGLSLSGEVNIPWGSVCAAESGVILWEGRPICHTTSQNAYDYFARDDDGHGLERGKLTDTIIAMLAKRNGEHQARWDRVWADTLCQRYRRSDHEDYWLWSHDFYSASIEELQHIYKLIERGATHV